MRRKLQTVIQHVLFSYDKSKEENQEDEKN